jgi:hypothetical protein
LTAPVLSITTSNGRHYRHPRNGKEVPSITNVIGKLDKPALKWWAAKQAATFAAQNIEVISQLKTEAERIDLIKGAPFRSTAGSSDIGNQVHDWIDGYAKNYLAAGGARDWVPEDLDQASITARRMWNQFVYIDGYYEIDWLVSEFTVWSDAHEYAGTGDWIARIGGAVVYGDTKCFVPETLITMADGTEKPAREVHHGDYVAAWDGGKVVASRVAACGENGIKPVVRLTTLGGRSLTVTHDHPVLTDAGLVKAVDLAVGNRVRVGAANGQTITPIPDNDAYLVGLACGDGGLSHGAVRITTMDPAIVGFLDIYAAGLSLRVSKDSGPAGGKAATYSLTGRDARMARNPVTQMFREMGLMGCLSGTKFVPDAVMAGGHAAWAHFMAGYLDTDGCIRTASQGGWNVSWLSKSERMIRQCQSILTGLRVRSRVNRIVSSYHGGRRYYWQLTVGDRRAVLALQAVIPPRGRRSAELSVAAIPPVPSRHGKPYEVTDPDFDKVTSIEKLAIARPTVWIEVAGTHMHITNGVHSENTGNGVYPEVGLQVAAGANADYALDGDGNEYQLPQPEKYAVLHVRPTFTRMSPLNGIPGCFRAFLALRAVFDWQTTESEQVLSYAPQIKGPR